jgi:hypothetical protein
MLTVLDADIDIGALLDGADDSLPALDVANEAVALIEAGGNVLPLHASQASAEPDGMSDVQDGGDPGSGEPPETMDDKRHRMSDLLQRLGLSVEGRQQDFRVYGHATYGRGWPEREQDVDGMNARLTEALSDPAALDREIESAKQSVHAR